MQTATEAPAVAEPQRLLDARQAAKMLGIGESTFHRHRALGLIGPDPVRLGGSIRWDRLQLERWIDACCPEADAWKAIEEASRMRNSPKGTLRFVSKRG